MGARVSVRIHRNRLPEIARILPEAAGAIVHKHGAAMVDTAKQRSRVDTGAMRDGWRWERLGQAEGRLTNDVAHTIYNERGTRFMTAQPMALPAFEQEAPLILDDFRRIEDALR